MQILILDCNLQLFYPPLLTIDKNCQTIYLFKKKKGSGIHAKLPSTLTLDLLSTPTPLSVVFVK